MELYDQATPAEIVAVIVRGLLSDAQLQQIEKSSPATKELFAASRAAMSGEFLKPGLEYPR
jgi:hypothetical protein